MGHKEERSGQFSFLSSSETGPLLCEVNQRERTVTNRKKSKQSKQTGLSFLWCCCLDATCLP